MGKRNEKKWWVRKRALVCFLEQKVFLYHWMPEEGSHTCLSPPPITGGRPRLLSRRFTPVKVMFMEIVAKTYLLNLDFTGEYF